MSKHKGAPAKREPKGNPLNIFDPMQFNVGELTQLALEMREIFRAPDKEGFDQVFVLQLRYGVALCKFAQFLRGSGVGDDVAGRFEQLGSAMLELQQGVVHPMLREAKAVKSPLERTEITYVRGMAALGLECLLRLGMSREEAAKHVFKQYPPISRLVKPKAKPQSSLLNWRDRLKEGKWKNVAIRDMYEENRQFFEHAGPEELRAQAEKVLKRAAEKASLIIMTDDN